MSEDDVKGFLNADEIDFLNDILNDDNDEINSFNPSSNNNNSKYGLPYETIKTYGENPFQHDAMMHVPLSASPRSPVRSDSNAKKCTELYLGGTELKPGFNDLNEGPHFCSNMQCFCCDHIVLRFPDCKWAKDTDYLFTRNNYPNNLDSKLISAPGWCAFCCQCTFRDEKEIQRLKPYSTNWVCRGHN